MILPCTECQYATVTVPAWSVLAYALCHNYELAIVVYTEPAAAAFIHTDAY
jgi:hypothetical protein